MAELMWDQQGERLYETGVDHGVLYIPNGSGAYTNGVVWNGLTAVNETPSGAEPNPQYADNIKYLTLTSNEEFGATIEAFTYPDEFGQFDGTAKPAGGVTIGQQRRRSFGFSYRTKVGNDLEGSELGYKLHMVYGAKAAPSEKSYATINDSPEAITFSWELTTDPVPVGTIGGVDYSPTAILTIDSTDPDTDPTSLAALEQVLYGSEAVDPRLPLPSEIIGMFDAGVVEVETVPPTYDDTTDMVTIPSVTGVAYWVDGESAPAGAFGPITDDVIVTATPEPGYVFTAGSDDDWVINFV